MTIYENSNEISLSYSKNSKNFAYYDRKKI